MSDTATTPALHVPLLQPVPVEGCAICGAAAKSRASAREVGSTVSVRAADETIRQHPHRRTTDRKGEDAVRAEVRRTRRPGASAPARFQGADEVAVGAVVFDKDRDMPATVRGMDGSFVEVDRPTGLAWRVHFSRLRPASVWEQRQLVAVGRLHAQQRRGLA